jgi:hypothetical protein
VYFTLAARPGSARVEMEVDGLVVCASGAVLLNSVKQTPSLRDVEALTEDVARLEHILATAASDAARVATLPPGAMDALRGRTAVAPFLSGFCFGAEVERACHARGVGVVRTDGRDFALHG